MANIIDNIVHYARKIEQQHCTWGAYSPEALSRSVRQLFGCNLNPLSIWFFDLAGYGPFSRAVGIARIFTVIYLDGRAGHLQGRQKEQWEVIRVAQLVRGFCEICDLQLVTWTLGLGFTIKEWICVNMTNVRTTA